MAKIEGKVKGLQYFLRIFPLSATSLTILFHLHIFIFIFWRGLGISLEHRGQHYTTPCSFGGCHDDDKFDRIKDTIT